MTDFSKPVDTWSYEAKSIMWTAGVLDRLQEIGLITFDAPMLQVKGIGVWDQLTASGFKPETRAIVESLKCFECPGELFSSFLLLIVAYRDGILDMYDDELEQELDERTSDEPL